MSHKISRRAARRAVARVGVLSLTVSPPDALVTITKNEQPHAALRAKGGKVSVQGLQMYIVAGLERKLIAVRYRVRVSAPGFQSQTLAIGPSDWQRTPSHFNYNARVTLIRRPLNPR